MNIEELLKTETGARALKAKLKSLSDHEKAKPNYTVLWKKACDAVTAFNLAKMKKELRDGIKTKDIDEKNHEK
ncbi:MULTISPECIES: hypothetical protein [Cysteiniphilum]|uniref:Uncharacterized protein n=1 Tax=Cysteiniphilum litorale TaxID=2056700 RepID=A0A8J2Z7H8_9GAMM|nr:MULTISPECIES: hypothetical protein [Cysteiniphilum]GGG08781.1 hypothetical protein GCM10010995_27920 [Cysteiniphilum litorale]